MGTALVAYATRTAAARDAAHAVAEVLREAGHEVRIADLKDEPPVDDVEFVVLGSGIHAGGWYPEAVTWAATHAEALRGRAVAVFNTCLSVRDDHAQGLGYNSAMATRTGATHSGSFAGRYVPEKVGFLRRLLMKTMQKPAQDHFDADTVRAWARTLDP